MRAINLLPAQEQRSRLEGLRTPLLAVAGAVAAVTAVAIVLATSASSTFDARQAELDAIEAAIARLPRAPKSAVSQGALMQERSDRTAALSAALSTRVSFDRLLSQIALVLPEDAWLTGLRAAAPVTLQPVPGTPGTPGTAAPSPSSAQGVTIDGATYSHDGVSRVLSRLSTVPSLGGVSLAASALVVPRVEPSSTQNGNQTAVEPTGRKRYVTFTISASLKTGATP